MNKIVIIAVSSLILLMSSALMAMDMGKDSGGQGGMDHSKMESMNSGQMEHGTGQMGQTFKKDVMVDGIHAEFQVMSLASMHMSDPEGHTHHVMVTFMKDGQPMTSAVGKVKLIAPSGKDQIGDLKDFGSGVFAASFTIDEPGKWGVICLFKDGEGQKHTVKFWYPHEGK